MYPAELVNPMKEELTQVGFQELLTPEAVNESLKKEGTTLLVINSVCGCGARTARPGVVHSLQASEKKPDHIVTSFAGYDKEAVAEARKYLQPYLPSSPCIALFKDGKLVSMIERYAIEGRSADMISEHLQELYKEFC